MVGLQYQKSFLIEMVIIDLLSCLYIILYHLIGCKMVYD